MGVYLYGEMAASGDGAFRKEASEVAGRLRKEMDPQLWDNVEELLGM